MSVADYETIKADAFNGVVYCHCLYLWKDNLKKLGFKWQPKLKLWYIKAENFSFEMYKETMTPRFVNHTTSGTMYYYYVFYYTSEAIKSRLSNQKDFVTKYAEEKAELGKREIIKANKEVKAKNNKESIPENKNAEYFGAGFYITD